MTSSVADHQRARRCGELEAPPCAARRSAYDWRPGLRHAVSCTQLRLSCAGVADGEAWTLLVDGVRTERGQLVAARLEALAY